MGAQGKTNTIARDLKSSRLDAFRVATHASAKLQQSRWESRCPQVVLADDCDWECFHDFGRVPHAAGYIRERAIAYNEE